MRYQLIKAQEQHKAVINNLMQFYMYDFSEFVSLDVEEDGLFAPYHNLGNFWNDEKKFPYVLQKDDKHIGFVLIAFIETEQRNYFSVAEFFVMKKYRHSGIGKAVAHEIFHLHRGNWEVFQKETNKPAQLFWNKVIDEYTSGNFTKRFENGKTIQAFDNG